MFRRILCFLLTMSLLASQSICWAHAHTHMDSARGGEHSTRPHLHVGGHDHHDQRHDEHAHRHRAGVDPLTSQQMHAAGRLHVDSLLPHRDHDSDAVYFGTPTSLPGIATVTSLELDQASPCEQPHVGYDDIRLRVSIARTATPFDTGLTCPLYLRKLSLRL